MLKRVLEPNVSWPVMGVFGMVSQLHGQGVVPTWSFLLTCLALAAVQGYGNAVNRLDD